MSQQDVLISTVGADYTHLRNLLAAAQWRNADEETGALMRKIARRVDAGWLREEDIAEFPSLDLDTIDQLWTKYSDERFGFSVQSRIWEKVEENYAKFGDAVGWRLNYNWQWYSDLMFNLNAPVGHLPAAPFFKSDGHSIGWAVTISPKLAECCDVEF